MTTTTTPASNGRVVRKSLAAQIDRLDNMLDGLADGLNEAVADAVKSAVADAVREAVQTVLTEVLTNPDLVARLRAAQDGASAAIPVATVAARPTLRERMRRAACKVGSACAVRLRRLREGLDNVRRQTSRRLVAVSAYRHLLPHCKLPLLVALSIGITVGVAAWFAGPFFAAFSSGVGGFTTALTLQAGLWLRRMVASSKMA
jgi:hypothetical protein